MNNERPLIDPDFLSPIWKDEQRFFEMPPESPNPRRRGPRQTGASLIRVLVLFAYHFVLRPLARAIAFYVLRLGLVLAFAFWFLGLDLSTLWHVGSFLWNLSASSGSWGESFKSAIEQTTSLIQSLQSQSGGQL